MKVTLKDMSKILGYLDVTKATTERAIKESTGTYKECMQNQLGDIEALIAKIENIEV